MNQLINNLGYRDEETIVNNVKTVLKANTWFLEVLKELVMRNPSFINRPAFHGKTILEVMICDPRGTDDIVSYLIDYNADVNLASYHGCLLLKALSYCRKRQEIVKVLLERGANIADERGGVSALSLAVGLGYGTDILEMITSRGADPNHINRHSQSVLCVALADDRELEILEFLINAGATSTACQMHKSPLLCLVCGRTLRSDVVRLILRNGVKGNVVADGLNRTVIHHVLRNCTYETGAVHSLIHSASPDVNARDEKNSTMLHDALWNRDCKLGAVKLLTRLGARVDRVDNSGDTPLHMAVMTRPCHPGIVRVLLESGSPVNVVNGLGETAIHIAVKKQQSFEVLRLLMGSGERVCQPPFSNFYTSPPNPPLDVADTVRGLSMWVERRVSQLTDQPSTAIRFRYRPPVSPILSVAVRHFEVESNEDNLDRLQTIIKYSLLENPATDIYSFIERYSTACGDPLCWAQFWYVCLREIDLMVRTKISGDLQLIDIVRYDVANPYRNHYNDLSDINNRCLLNIVRKRDFSFYSEIIAAKIGYEFLEEVFPSIHLSTIQYAMPEKYKVTLNSHCLRNLGKFLSHNDLLNMILAFHSNYQL